MTTKDKFKKHKEIIQQCCKDLPYAGVMIQNNHPIRFDLVFVTICLHHLSISKRKLLSVIAQELSQQLHALDDLKYKITYDIADPSPADEEQEQRESDFKQFLKMLMGNYFCLDEALKDAITIGAINELNKDKKGNLWLAVDNWRKAYDINMEHDGFCFSCQRTVLRMQENNKKKR